MTEQAKKDEVKHPLLDELQGIVNEHQKKIEGLPFGADKIIVQILKYVGKFVRSHARLEARVAALEGTKTE